MRKAWNKISNEEFLKRLEKQNPNIISLEEYKSTDIKIKFFCKKHSKEFCSTPKSVLGGSGCRICSSEHVANGQRLSFEEFSKKFKTFENKIELIGEYNGSRGITLFRCKIDGYIWRTYPGNILRGAGCSKCAKNIKLTDEEFKARLKDSHPHIECLEKYVNNHVKLLFKCSMHDYIFSAKPNDFIKLNGCPKCGKEMQIKHLRDTHEEFVNKLYRVNPYVQLLENYQRRKTKVLCRCLLDNYEWMASPGQLLDNHGCPECRSRSRGEKKIHNYLTVNKVNHVQQKEFSDCIDKSLLPFDFYLPKYNLIIEFMGKQHEIPIEFFGGLEAFKSRKMHDDIKFQYCVKNNIDYLDIWYYEYSDIDNIIIKKLNDIEKGIKYAVIK